MKEGKGRHQVAAMHRSICTMAIPDNTEMQCTEAERNSIRIALKFCYRLTPAATKALMGKIEPFYELAMRSARNANHQSFKQWVAEAMTKGASTAHKWTSVKVKTPSLPALIVCDEIVLSEPMPLGAYWRGYWAELWQQRGWDYEATLMLMDIMRLTAMYNNRL